MQLPLDYLVCQYLLLVFHQLLVSFMDADRRYVVIRPPFYPVHRMYLWASTAQWFVMLPLAWWTLRAWAAESAAAGSQPAFTPGSASSAEFKSGETGG